MVRGKSTSDRKLSYCEKHRLNLEARLNQGLSTLKGLGSIIEKEQARDSRLRCEVALGSTMFQTRRLDST